MAKRKAGGSTEQDEREAYRQHKASVLTAVHDDERASLKYLASANGGLAVSLATWLQHCFSSEASFQQRALVTPLLYGLSAAVVGIALAVLLPLVGGRTDFVTMNMIETHEAIRRLRRNFGRYKNSQGEPPPAEWLAFKRLQQQCMESNLQAIGRASGRWIFLWHAVSVLSWLAFFVGITIVLIGGFHARVASS
jgi:hypothetical protein